MTQLDFAPFTKYNPRVLQKHRVRKDKLKTLFELKFGSWHESIHVQDCDLIACQTFKDTQWHLYALKVE